MALKRKDADSILMGKKNQIKELEFINPLKYIN